MEINTFPDEHLNLLEILDFVDKSHPLFADIANYLAANITPRDLSSQ